jgi:hypothetical protein
MSSSIDGDLIVRGTISSTRLTIPAGSVSDAQVPAGANINANKLQHHEEISVQLFAPGTTIVNVTQLLHINRSTTATVIDVRAAITTQATGGDRTVTVDVQKATGGGAFATIMSSTVNITNSTAINTSVDGSVGAAGALVAGDVLQIVVTVAGAAGAQAKGLVVSATIQETAN